VRSTAAILSTIICLAFFTPRCAPAQASLPSLGDSFAAHHTQAKLILSADTAKPGDTIWAGLDLKMEPGWHTYWKNPGDAGSPTKIEWTLPPGISAGEIQWPLPEKLPPAEVTTYGYENEVVLLVPLTLAPNLPAGPLNLTAKVSWLECKESCIPASANVQATLNVGGETKNSADAATIELWENKVPTSNGPILHLNYMNSAWWEKPANDNSRPLIVERQQVGAVAAAVPFDGADFFPNASDQFEIQPATEIIAASTSDIKLRLLVKKFSGEWPDEISGVLATEVRGQRQGTEVNSKIADRASTSEMISATANQPALPPQPLWQMLFFAFIGGLILNIMPCVLPVIALKILGFVSEARSAPRRVRKLGLIYALGVLLSFLALAAVVIGVKAAGHHAGWGMQFGSPVFIVCLTTLVTLVALNLFGIFEVTLGGHALDMAGELASKHGAAGAFFNGVLATVLATPCTAPFLGAALGFAFAQSASVIVLIFLTVGLGLAAPYILLSWNPAWLKFLPKPGAWMEKFKIAMGFPMLATVVWLFNVAASSYGKNVLWLGIFLVLIAFAAWIFGEFFQRGRRHKGGALAITFILLTGGYAFALEKELDWRAAMPETSATCSLKESADGIDWQRWSPEAVAQARAAGKPVLVDFTADWCLTCQVNKKTSLEILSVRAKLKLLNAVALLGDYTHFPDAITTELNRYNRAGVPLVLVYPKNADAAVIVLPEILTPGIVLDALDRAAK
jgi:thiol:disulfide interchange protein DsbD